MFTIDTYDYDCTKKCRCRDHGHQITGTLTKRGVSDENLAAYIAKVCRNFAEVLDHEGRSALHLASSVDRYAIVEWLLNHGSNVNGKDEESGNSALHRALFYGCIDCAVLLLRYGASFELTDKDFRNPLQYICKPAELDYFYEIPQRNEILTWGTNKNYNLGLGNDQNSSSPQSIETFRKLNISVESLAIGSYHSMFIDTDGNVYSVGHGTGGRLGSGSESTLPVPKRLKLPTRDSKECAICVSVSRNHSLILTNKGSIYTCGINTDHQLGLQPAPEKSAVLKEISAFKQFGIEGLTNVIARDYHSIAFSSKEVYIWGANKGQFGIKAETSHVTLPRQLQLLDNKRIALVESNNSAIACYTACKLVLLYHNYKMKSIKTPSLEPLICMSLTGGCVKRDGKSDSDSVLRLLVLTISKCLYIWYEDSMQYVRCVYLQTRQLDTEKMILSGNQLLILSRGDVYTGQAAKQIIHNPIDISEYKDTYNKKEISTTARIRIDLKRMSNVDRVVDIFADDDFESFAVLQESSRKYFSTTDLPEVENTFKTLLHEVSEMDAVHDVVYHVDGETFPAHRFIVYSRSKGIMKAVGHIQDKHVYLNYQGLSGKMFSIMLEFMYTNYMPVLENLDEVHQSLGPSYMGTLDDSTNLFLNFCIKFELHGLVNGIKSLLVGVSPTKPKFQKFKRSALTDLHDVKIICAGEKEVFAHKCVLVARLEYFNLMFSNSWSETKTVNLSSIPIEYMAPLIDFLYSHDVEAFKKENYSENYLYNMIVICDQFFVNSLRRVCEKMILERISTSKCGEMLDFGCAYNCEVLEKGCLQFICQNLARILEQKSLEACEPKVLAKINEFYRRTYKQKLDYRVITPTSDAISDEELIEHITDFSVDLEYRMEGVDGKSKVKSKARANKSAICKRNYEKEAIQSMKELIVGEKQQRMENKDRKTSESSEVDKQLHSEAKSWMKVSSDNKSKDSRIKSLMAAMKANEILKEEVKAKEIPATNLIPLSKTPVKNDPSIAEDTVLSPNSRFNLNLSDFTPLKGEKLSQKQRKRLSSESKPESPNINTSKPIPIPTTPNAWGIVQSPSSNDKSSSFAAIMRSPSSTPKFETSSIEKSHSRISVKSSTPTKASNVSRNLSFAESSPSTSTYRSADNSFSKIIEGERRQKEYFDRMKSKSLVLTQIEETAIAELEDFYNVNNVFDEWIRVDRRPREQTINFAIWQHN